MSKEKAVTSVHLMTGFPARPDEQLQLKHKTNVLSSSQKKKEKKNKK
jgi:hypothetical protein